MNTALNTPSGSGDGHPMRFVARQPIFDSKKRAFGYEILYRSGPENHFTGESNAASRQMLDNFLLFGVDTLARGGKAFLNCTRELLVKQLVTFLPAQSTVLEVLETIEPDEELVSACAELKKSGYQVALDDFVPRPGLEPLIELADYIKLDFRACGPAKLNEIRKVLRNSNAQLIAEKIESHAEYERACIDGYSYFQGYFFCRPAILSSREIPANSTSYLRLLTALSRSPLDLKEVERLVMADASLCYRLLRLVNSAAFGVRRQVTSVRSALVITGDDEFRKLVSIVLTATLGKKSSPELMLVALQRARFCELMSGYTRQPASEQYLIGLLSVMDAILQLPMSEIAGRLPLRPEAANSLLGQDTSAASALKLATSWEAGEWDACSALADSLSLTEPELTRLYIDSLKWADEAASTSPEN